MKIEHSERAHGLNVIGLKINGCQALTQEFEKKKWWIVTKGFDMNSSTGSAIVTNRCYAFSRYVWRDNRDGTRWLACLRTNLRFFPMTMNGWI